MEEIKRSLDRTAAACERIAAWLESQNGAASPTMGEGWVTGVLEQTDDGPPPPPVGSEPPLVDADGRMWDERIDSSSKSFTADGKWRARRNVSPMVRAEVLRQIAATAPPPPAETTAPPPPAETTAPPPPAETTAPPPPAEVAPMLTFPRVVKLITDAGYTLETIKPFLEPHGLTTLPLLAGRQDLWLSVLAEMGVEP